MNRSAEVINQIDAQERGFSAATGEAFLIATILPAVGPEGALKIVESFNTAFCYSKFFDHQLHEKFQRPQVSPKE